MKKTMIISACMLFCCMARAQLQTPLSLISNSAGIGSTTMLGKSNTVEWTIGETKIGLGDGSGYFVPKPVVTSNIYLARNPITVGVNGTPRTSNETRPKNVYVNYIIKY